MAPTVGSAARDVLIPRGEPVSSIRRPAVRPAACSASPGGAGSNPDAGEAVPSTDLQPLNGIEDGAALLAAGDAVVSTDYEGLGWPGPNPYHS
jgi:hypothetical protein